MRQTTAQRVAGSTLVGIATFQAALALGAPWGQASYGGANVGVLPPQQRLSSTVAVPVYLALAAVAFGLVGTSTLRRRVLRTASLVLGVGAVLNLASPSLVERVLWVPVCVVASVASWRAAPACAEPVVRTA
ncbi:hypothetical protein [Cellulomonas sp. URHE0023]|uniref:hypothetical protein n=1 Tax=Cellulomonas sp. URHE0023 TaxID=1380354 RepID=UPI00068B677B|nr:hypothetical protein [Cellulomonas sp. URHE0023]